MAELEFLKHPRKDEDYSQRDRDPLAGASCLGLYQTDGQPSARQDTRRCPGPCARAALAGPQSHGIQLTITRPGPHG